MTSSRRLLLLLLGLLGIAVAVRSQRQQAANRYPPQWVSEGTSRATSAGRPFPGSGGALNNRQLKGPNAFVCPQQEGVFAYPNQCSKYYECRNGVATVRRCPEGLLFHPREKYPCVLPSETVCETTLPLGGAPLQQRQPQGQGQDQRIEPVFDCSGQSSYVVDTVDCGHYAVCKNGVPISNHCAEGLAFDVDREVCDHADEVDSCNAAAYLDFDCPTTVAEIAHFAHPQYCEKFFICLRKEDDSVRPRLGTCQHRTVFSLTYHDCRDPMTVEGCEYTFADV